MGSPYMHSTVNRVNVVRSARGMIHLAREICHITGSNGLLVVAEAFCNVPPLYSDVTKLSRLAVRNAYEEMVWGAVNELEEWYSFGQTFVDLLVNFLVARQYCLRLVSVVATRYEFAETQILDRAVVIDFTKEGLRKE